ncbi:Retrovirus-related Pol polyprotein from type-1 retrotransposable element R2, partial [Diplonema papillatum]
MKSDGCFWRPVGKEARDATPVVALNADVTRETALALLKKCGEAGGGVVLGGRRLLLRARGSGMLARVRAAAGEHAAPPLETKLRYLVSGARAREHEADVEMLLRLAGWAATVTTSFVRSGSRTCVVTGDGGPPFRVIEREGSPFIVVNDYDKGEMPRPRSKRLASSLPTTPGQRRRMKLPAAEVHTDPEPAPSNKRKHEEVTQPAEAGQSLIQRAVAGVVEMLSPPRQRLKEPVEGEKAGHRHELSDGVRAPAEFKCGDCQKTIQKGRMQRRCEECGASVHDARADGDAAGARLMRCGDVHPNPGPGRRALASTAAAAFRRGRRRRPAGAARYVTARMQHRARGVGSRVALRRERVECAWLPSKHDAREYAYAAGERLLRCGDVHPNPGPPRDLTLAAVNVGSLALHIDEVRAMAPADAIAVLETSMGELQQTQATDYLARPCAVDGSRWKTLWGPPQPPKRSKHCPHGNPHSGQKGGGVVVLARQPGVAHLLPNESLQEVRNRVIHTMIATGVGRMFVHFFAVYAPSGNTAAASRERLLQTVLFEAQAMVGQAPAVVMGDFNTDVERSPALRHALSNGWTDAAQLQAACEGGRPPNTYTGTNTSGTRIDYALMNRAAASAFVACETIGVGSVRGHRCVRIRLAVQAFEQQTWRFNVPRAIPVKPAGRVVEVPRLDAVCAAAREGDVEGAWMALSALCEQYLLDRSGMPACERRAHTGRGNSELKMTRVAARSTPDRGVACETELRHGNAIRRLEHYVYQRARLEASGPFQVPQELRLCWLRCLAVIRGGGVGEPPPSDPPSAEVARVYLHDVRLRSARYNAAAARVRKRQQHERQLTMFGTDRRALVTMLRGGPGQAADAVRTADGRLTANVEEMDEVLQEAWDPILRMYGEGRPEPEYEVFRRAFEGFIPRRQMDLRDVTGRELRDVLNKRKKKTTACGVDGWRLDELKALPDELLDGFATLFNLVEERGEWPKGMLTSLVSLIPKTDDTSPTNLRPITVTSCVYRLWACRRLQDVMEWQEGWVLPTQHGFRSGHRTDDVLMELTTLIEETLLDETKSLYMVALDFAKCFDRVPQGIVLSLAEEMGLDARILRPLRAMYRGMKRRFKLPLGVGSEFEVTNGILQGCPLSVILINALLSVVLRAVSVRVPEVSSESLADDATLLAPAEAELQQAVDIVARFCALTGMRLNMSKTVAMGIRAGSTQQRRRRPYASAVKVGGEAIVTATSAKILGVRTSVESVRASRANDARLSAHDGLIDRLSTSKLPFDVRCEVASSNVLSSVLAGCSYETYTQTRLKGFRTRVVRGAFGSRQPSRSVTAVLSILAKGHRLDPVIARPYRILCSFFDACERLPRVYARMLNIARLYSRHGVLLPEARLGPVGIAISDGFTVAGIGFEGRDFATAALEGRRLLDMERGERHHAIRARLRQTTWTQLARQRPSYDGVQAGVDCRRTNELRLATADAGEKRALAVILSGGVFLAARWGRNARANGGAAGSDGSPSSSASVSSTASDTTGSFDEHASESSSSEPQRPPLDRGCRDCDRGVQDTADHLWWECPAYDEIRGRPCFAELLRADRARWPSCTRVHGVIVEGMRVEVAALHRLMAAVYTARVEAERRRLSAVQPMHPWHAAAPLPAVQHVFNFDRLPDEPPRWPYGGRAMRALKGWLSALRWTNAGEVSCVELAVDFEVHTGVDVPAPPGIRRLAANQRGKTLWTMLSTLCRLCRDLQLPSPLPAERKVRVGSMRTLGAPMLWGGLTPRPRFAGGEETHGVLEASFPRAAAGDGKNWGGDVFPQYDAARRAQRSLRWDVPTPLPQRPRLPVLVPAAQADPLLRTQS